jgi:hypothetical protein
MVSKDDRASVARRRREGFDRHLVHGVGKITELLRFPASYDINRNEQPDTLPRGRPPRQWITRAAMRVTSHSRADSWAAPTTRS